ncbi:hypothetical protein [Spongiactinospora rosea]|nr:hypothetical protein [Spongiactinospora rosea]
MSLRTLSAVIGDVFGLFFSAATVIVVLLYTYIQDRRADRRPWKGPRRR